MTRLAFVTWNIAGGIDGGSDERLYREMELLAALEPTAVALQECKDWDNRNFRTLHLSEHLLGMRGFLAPSSHHGCHLAIFVRESAVRVVEQRHEYGDPWWHGVACVVVTAEGFPQPLQLVSSHLAPSSPERRLAEAEAFALVAERGPLIAGGDWNALPVNDPEPTGPVTGKDRRKLDRRAAQALEEIGLLDVGACVGNTTRTVGHASGLPYRCDRVYTSLPAETVTSYEVITGADSESDHRAAIAEFDLDRIAGYDQWHANCVRVANDG